MYIRFASLSPADDGFKHDDSVLQVGCSHVSRRNKYCANYERSQVAYGAAGKHRQWGKVGKHHNGEGEVN